MENNFSGQAASFNFKTQSGKEIHKNYVFTKTLYQNETHQIHQAIDLQANTPITIKIINKQNYESKDHILWEINNHKKMLPHQNIVVLKDVYEDQKYIYIIMEPCGQSLAQLLSKRKYFLQREVQFIFCQLVNILEHLRRNNIVHRAISLDCLFVNKNELKIKLGDFSQSVNLSFLRIFPQKKNDTLYSSPQWIGVPHTKTQLYSNDLWAIGVVIFNLLTGQQPFAIKGNLSLLKIKNCSYEFPEINGSDIVSTIWKELIKKIFTFINKRIHLSELIDHPLMQIEQTLSMNISPEIFPAIQNNFIAKSLKNKKKSINLLSLKQNTPLKQLRKTYKQIPDLINQPQCTTQCIYDSQIDCLAYIVNKSLGVLLPNKTVIVGHNQTDYEVHNAIPKPFHKKYLSYYRHFLKYFGVRIIKGDLSIWIQQFWKKGNIWIFKFNNGTWQISMGNGIALIDIYNIGWWKGQGCQIHRIKVARKIIKEILMEKQANVQEQNIQFDQNF